MKISQRHSGLPAPPWRWTRIRILVLARMTTSGFTLLELMIVVAITSILTGAGVVSFMGSKRSTAVRLAAENFAQFLRTTEGMTRSGASFPDGQSPQQLCDDGSIPPRLTTSPCGGYGVVVGATGYDRFADIRNIQPLPAVPQKDASESLFDHRDLPDNVSFVTGGGAIVFFVPPKDQICLADGSASSVTECGPRDLKEVAWKLEYAGTIYHRTVKLNTLSGIVMVE